MHDMVNQLTSSGVPFSPTEAVTGLEALRAFTYGSAYVRKQEHLKGTLTVGSDRIKDIEVLRTLVWWGRRAAASASNCGRICARR